MKPHSRATASFDHSGWAGTVTANKGTAANYDIGKGNIGSLIRDGESDGTITIAASVTSSDGKHYTNGNYLNGYNKEN